MDTEWMYQKNETKNEELDVARSSHHEPKAKKAKMSLGGAGFIEDECEADGQNKESENDGDYQISAEDIAFIDDLLNDETSWGQYLNF